MDEVYGFDRRLWETVVFTRGRGALCLDSATEDDVPELARLNQNVQLDLTRYQEVFSSGERSFAQHGGFLSVMDASELTRCLHSDRSALFTLREAGYAGGDTAAPVGTNASTITNTSTNASTERIIASLWISLDDPGFAAPSPDFLRALGEHPALDEALKQGTVCYARELIVAKDAPRSISPSRAVFYGGFSNMLKAGFNYALAEVYRIIEYHTWDEEGKSGVGHPVDSVNEAALHSVADAGGFRIGRNTVRVYELEKYVSLTIEPQVVLFELIPSLQKLSQELTAQGVHIERMPYCA
ncbi:MAG: major capsid protein [Coriobacteriales bacterium]|nr:major capsid protein [Coriobacteriales bacterium]